MMFIENVAKHFFLERLNFEISWTCYSCWYLDKYKQIIKAKIEELNWSYDHWLQQLGFGHDWSWNQAHNSKVLFSFMDRDRV